MKISVNGSERTVASPCTVEQLLEQLELSGNPCAVEVNTRVVPKREYADHLLAGGDRVEVVSLVGGG